MLGVKWLQVEPGRGYLSDVEQLVNYMQGGYAALRAPKVMMELADHPFLRYGQGMFGDEPVYITSLIEDMAEAKPDHQGRSYFAGTGFTFPRIRGAPQWPEFLRGLPFRDDRKQDTSVPMMIMPGKTMEAVDAARAWILDTGTCYHITSERNIVDLKRRKQRLAVPQTVSTAAGPMDLTHAVASRIPAIDSTLTVMMAKNTPDALSVGRLCAQNGFRFEWLPYKKNPTSSTTKGITSRPTQGTSYPIWIPTHNLEQLCQQDLETAPAMPMQSTKGALLRSGAGNHPHHHTT